MASKTHGAASCECLPLETSDDRILRRALGVPMFREGE